MKRVFSLWVLDIAKYVITALVLSTVFSDVTKIVSRWVFYPVCFVVVVCIVLVGVLLYKAADKDDKKNNSSKP
jgi:hypothetical protein